MKQLVHGHEFVINLETDHVILHGSVEESAGVILRGSVTLKCHENTKVKSVTLKFQGKTKVQWVGGHVSNQRHYKEEKTIIEHTWNFLEPKKKMHHLSEGQYKWDFELPLPGDLPHTVQHDMGEVYYRLKAVAERPTFSMKLVAKRSIVVTRLLLPSALEVNQSGVLSDEWANKLAYNITVPRMAYSCGDPIPVSFDLVPTDPGVHIRAILCILKEYVTLSAQEHTMNDSKIVKRICDNHFEGTQSRYTRTEVLEVPEEQLGSIQSDTNSDLIIIRHKLKFTVILINGDGHISELHAALPIVIASFAPEEDASELPTYENAWKSLPYDSQTIERLIEAGYLPRSMAIAIPNAAASNIQSYPDSANNSGDEESAAGNLERLPWEGMDLSRVPSYTTAVRSGRLYSFSGSLPPYEAAAIPGTTS